MEKVKYQLEKLVDIPAHQLKYFPQEVMLASKSDSGWAEYSTQTVVENINKVSAALLSYGIKNGDCVAIIASNSPQWNFIDFGCQQIGVISVPLYSKMSEDEYIHIFNDAKIKLAFTDDLEIFEKLKTIAASIPALNKTLIIGDDQNMAWKDFINVSDPVGVNEIEERKAEIDEEDVATIVYTSGTTGKPKGVMLTHKNMVSNVTASIDLMPVGDQGKALSFLPLNHVFERMLNYLYMVKGISIYYAESIDTIGENIKEVKPNVFATVPRLLEKVYEKIVEEGKNLSFPKKAIFFWALRLAQVFDYDKKGWIYTQQLKLADKLVYRQWRQALGNNIIGVISGGASLNERVNRVFSAAKIPVMEGYGLTETSPVITVNRYEVKDRKIGSVGRPIENVEVRIAEDGEILCKGPNVMKGYHNLPERTAQVIRDGWFHTEDIGELEDGFLKITDRKKSMFKTSGGKYVAPQTIEKVMRDSHLIGQIMVVGEGQKMVTALIVPDFPNLKKWCDKHAVTFHSNSKIVADKTVIKKYEDIISNKNHKLNHTEQIKDFRLIGCDWSEETGELTPTLKVKRPVVQKKYKEQIDSMYENDN